MSVAWTVFKKEGLDTLRDKRSIIAMIVIPMVIFPVIFGVIGFFAVKEVKKAQEQQLKVGIVEPIPENALVDELRAREDFEITPLAVDTDPKLLIDNDELDLVLDFDEAFNQKVSENGAGEITFSYKSTGHGLILRSRVQNIITQYSDTLKEERITGLGYSMDFINPVNVTHNDIATKREQLGEVVGGFIPYIFILLCFTGAMYPAIDLGAGEKERGTLETLLCTSVSLKQVIMGKLMLVVCSGLVSAFLSLISMLVGVVFMGPRMGKVMEFIGPVLNASNLLMFFTLLLPLTLFFASALLTLSFFAKSFKEAQSIVSPLVAVVIVPSLFGMMPWMKLTYVTACVPIMNISLASKAIFSGTVEAGPLAIVYVSLILLAAAGFFTCTKMVAKESILFRT